MNIFKKYTYSWWQIGLLKLALLFLGMAIGTYWHEIFSQYINILIIVGIVLGVYLSFVSFKQ
ncbi:hypothetical protein IT399_01870 [Candidatus Nomurabacteria bacterium]|nr:hypothetical protein [Candidatus Nomurabacteria bacterium]